MEMFDQAQHWQSKYLHIWATGCQVVRGFDVRYTLLLSADSVPVYFDRRCDLVYILQHDSACLRVRMGGDTQAGVAVTTTWLFLFGSRL